MAMSLNAAALDSLNDSHTFILPGQKAYRHSSGVPTAQDLATGRDPVPAQALRRLGVKFKA